jgi:hypothetical protein
MRRFVALLVVMLALPASGCMMKPRHLAHPQGVMFVGWHSPNFESCQWRRDANNPQPCPIVVHFPTGDLGEKELSDVNALKRAGWTENGPSGLMFRENPPLVVCGYRRGVLVAVTVDTLPGNGGGPGVVSVNGKKVTLPATDEQITQALGPPLRRD